MNDFFDACATIALMPLLVTQAAGRQLAHAFHKPQSEADALASRVADVLQDVPVLPEPRKACDSDLYVGKSLSKSKVMTDTHTLLFGVISQDFNPLHFNDAVAVQSRFQGRITHGMHTASLFSGILAELTPWCAYLHQDVDFLAPVRPDEVITATGTIEEISDRGMVQVALTARTPDGTVVARGRAQVKKLKEMFESGAQSAPASVVSA